MTYRLVSWRRTFPQVLLSIRTAAAKCRSKQHVYLECLFLSPSACQIGKTYFRDLTRLLSSLIFMNRMLPKCWLTACQPKHRTSLAHFTLPQAHNHNKPRANLDPRERLGRLEEQRRAHLSRTTEIRFIETSFRSPQRGYNFRYGRGPTPADRLLCCVCVCVCVWSCYYHFVYSAYFFYF